MMPKGIAKKYAQALFNALASDETLEKAQEHFDHLNAFLEENKEIKNFLFYYPVRLDLKKETAQRISEYYAPQFQNFLLLLVEKKRFSLLPLVEEEFRTMVKKAKNIATAVVVTPMPLEEEQKSKLTALLQESTGKRIELEEQLDPALKGGFVIRLGEKVFDASVTGQLHRLYQRLIAESF